MPRTRTTLPMTAIPEFDDQSDVFAASEQEVALWLSCDIADGEPDGPGRLELDPHEDIIPNNTFWDSEYEPEDRNGVLLEIWGLQVYQDRLDRLPEILTGIRDGLRRAVRAVAHTSVPIRVYLEIGGQGFWAKSVMSD